MPVVHNAMMLIKPSSVDITGAGSSATINDSGSVTFSACESLSLNGVFSSTYDNYVINYWFTSSGGANIGLRLRLSGSDATASNYVDQLLSADSTSVTGFRGTQDRFRGGDSYGTQRAGFTNFMYGPALAQPTAYRLVAANDLTSAALFDGAGTHSLSTAYDGFTLYNRTAGTTFGGLVKVYGMRQ